MILSDDFGRDTMSANARDLFRIAVFVAGFDPKRLIREVFSRSRGERVNETSVANAMQRLHDAEKGAR